MGVFTSFYTWLAFMAVLCLSALAAIAWRNRTVSGAAPFAAVMISFTQYLTGVFLNYNTVIFWEKLLWTYYYILAAIGFTLAWFLMVLEISGYDQRLRSRVIRITLCLLGISSLLMVTNSFHGWFMGNIRIENNQINGERGFVYWLLIGSIFLPIIEGMVILSRCYLRNTGWRRRRVGMMMAGVFPCLLFALTLTIWRIFHPGGSLPVSILLLFPLAVTVWVFGWGVLRLRFLDIIPQAMAMAVREINDGMIVLDQRDNIVTLNIDPEKLPGGSRLENHGGKFGEVFQSHPRLLELAAGTELTAVEDYLESGGERKEYQIHIAPLVGRRGRLLGKTIILHDITIEKQSQARLAEQQKALSIMEERDRLARELHDSLGQIMGYLNIRIQAIRDKFAEGNFTEADHHLAHLAQVLEEANAEVREFIYGIKTSLLLKDGFFKTLAQYTARFSADFEIRVTINNPAGLTDRDLTLPVQSQLFRIIQEAFTNTRKHAQAKQITVVFQRNATNISISVGDDGLGFDCAKLPEDKHFGLGIMRERAAQVGGAVQVQSSSGQGTEVLITLPSLPDDRTAVSKNILAGADTVKEAVKQTRILLVDDHALFLDGLQNLLISKGFQVIATARNGWEGLEKARVYQPDLILMDIMMPECDGLMATRLIKAEMPRIKIVILTMSDREKDLFKAIKGGASGYLLKGLGAEDLLEELGRIISGQSTLSGDLAARVLDEFGIKNEAAQIKAEAAVTKATSDLTPRQAEVLMMVAQGWTYREIAAKLFISESTVKFHMREILDKLHLKKRSEVVGYARKMGL